ncbi:AAA family ATPase [Desulfonatronum parangueonense]
MKSIKPHLNAGKADTSTSTIAALPLRAASPGAGTRQGNNPKTRTIAIASGKGGAGKTTVSVSLAWSLAESGRNVCLVDVDLGLSNVDVLLGLNPRHTLEDVILGDVPVDRAVNRVRPGLDVISGGSGAAALADLDPVRRNLFLSRIKSLDHYDFLLLDNAPGIHRQVVAFCLAAREQIIVINPEPSSVTDGYALLKVLRQNGMRMPPYILLNRVQRGFDHATLTRRFAGVCKKHLQAAILPLGAIPDDPLFQQASAQSMAPAVLRPEAPAMTAVGRIASLLNRRKESDALFNNVENFWSASLNTLFQGLRIPGQPDSRAIAGKPTSVQDVLGRLEQVLTDLEDLGRTASGTNSLPLMTQLEADRLTRCGDRLRHLAATWKRCPEQDARTGTPERMREASDQRLQRTINARAG